MYKTSALILYQNLILRCSKYCAYLAHCKISFSEHKSASCFKKLSMSVAIAVDRENVMKINENSDPHAEVIARRILFLDYARQLETTILQGVKQAIELISCKLI